MKISHLSLALVLGASIFFTACGSKTPSCDDSEVKTKLDKIVKDEIGKFLAVFGISKSDLEQMAFSYNEFSTISTSESEKKVFCKVKVGFSYQQDKAEEYLDYSAQYTENGEIFVEILSK